MAIESFYPRPRPSLDLNFAAGNFDPRITFSRASAATYYDGRTTAKAEENLLPYSQQFDNWGKQYASVSQNSGVAPDGTSTAAHIVPDAAALPHGVIQNIKVVVGQSYTLSVYAKAGAYDRLVVTDNWHGVYTALFSLSSGTVVSAAGCTGSIISVGNGWYRCVIQFTPATYTDNTPSLVIAPSTAGGYIFTADGVSGGYLWGAQLEQRSQVTAYTPTTTQPITNYIPVLQTAPSGVPRIDHDPVTGECKGLLIEEQRTNLLKYSEQFDNAAWVKSNTTVLPNTLIAPDGTLTAASVRFNLGLANDRIDQPILSIYPVQGSVYTYSVWLKGSGTVCITVNTSDGTGGSSELAITLSNTWQRYSVSHTFLAGVAGVLRVHGLIIRSASNPTVGVWGAQLEAGSFPTSYIKTEASQVTRAADSASMTGANFSSWYRQDEGTLLSEWSTPVAISSATAVELSDGGISNRFHIQPNTAGTTRHLGFVNGSAQVVVDIPSATVGSVKDAFAYQAYRHSASRSGSSVVTSTSPYVPPGISRMSIGATNQGSNVLNGHIKRIAYYAESLPEYLQALTS